MAAMRIEGTLDSWRVLGRNGWGVGQLTAADGASHRLVGQVPGAKEGDSLRLTGRLVLHERYGEQFKIVTVEVTSPATPEAIEAWLCTLPNLGPTRARALVERFGTGLWTVLESDLAQLCTVDGITEGRAQELQRAYRETAGERDASLTLRSLGFKDGLLAKLEHTYGSLAEAVDQVRTNPYALQRDVHGIGFRIADRIAAELGFFGAHPQRVAAALRWVMEEASSRGHCFVREDKALGRTGEACGETLEAVRAALRIDDAAYQGITLVEEQYWLAATLRAEVEAAGMCVNLRDLLAQREGVCDESSLGW